jgi:hypothetical protein
MAVSTWPLLVRQVTVLHRQPFRGTAPSKGSWKDREPEQGVMPNRHRRYQ